MTTIERIKKDPRAKDIWNEGEDGWWIILTEGYCWPEGQTHAVHESSLKSLWSSFKTVKKCNCENCSKL